MTQILVVDDDASLRRLVCKLLAVAGYQTSQAANGREALAILREHPHDLLVTDIVMPDYEGLELIRHVRQLDPRLPIVAMSGGGDYVGADACLSVAKSLGARPIRKPFALEEFVRIVQGFVGPERDIP